MEPTSARRCAVHSALTGALSTLRFQTSSAGNALHAPSFAEPEPEPEAPPPPDPDPAPPRPFWPLLAPPPPEARGLPPSPARAPAWPSGGVEARPEPPAPLPGDESPPQDQARVSQAQPKVSTSWRICSAYRNAPAGLQPSAAGKCARTTVAQSRDVTAAFVLEPRSRTCGDTFRTHGLS